MFRHLFRMMWNKKKQNFLLITEMLISFLVLFAVFTLLVFYFHNYRKPIGFEYDRVWAVHFSSPLKTKNADSIHRFFDLLKKNATALPGIEGVTYTSVNVPFSQSSIQNGISYEGKTAGSNNWYTADINYQGLLGIKMIKGRWFNENDVLSKTKPVVINETLEKELFKGESPLGKLLGDNRELIVIGVIEDTKFNGDYALAGKATFNKPDSTEVFEHMLVRVSPEANAVVEGRLYKTLASFMRESNIEIEHLEDKRKSINYFALVPMIVLSIVSCFLIVNVALGLFGVLWYNINKRKGEIGLRRAVGASGNDVAFQLVAEALILATLSIIIGTFFAIQFPLLNVFDLPAGVYIAAIGLAILFIYVLVLICSLYPGRQAASIYPAVALHEE